MKPLLVKYFESPSVALGWSSAGGFFVSEHFELYAGMAATAVMLLSSIILQWYKIMSIRNEERRREEHHLQEMKQEQEIHELNIKRHGKNGIN